MKKNIFVLLLLIYSLQLFAQQKDTTFGCDTNCIINKTEKRFHFGIAGHYGLNYISINNQNNYLAGSCWGGALFIEYNINKKWHLIFESRLSLKENDGFHYALNNIEYKINKIYQSGYEFPFIVLYNVANEKRKIISPYAGFLYGNNRIVQDYEASSGIRVQYLSVIFGTNKYFSLSKKNRTQFFLGFEYNYILPLSDFKINGYDINLKEQNFTFSNNAIQFRLGVKV